MRAITLSLLAILALAGILAAQSPRTVIVPAATPVITSSQEPVAFDNFASLQAALRMLKEMKAANEETLQKQAATLEQLDELEKAADQLKIFSKRG
jgi:hypothetical protein